MEKLICDRCGMELMDRGDVVMAFEGKKAWEEALRAQGNEPRGVFPCVNFIRCGGEIKPTSNGGIFWWRH